MEAPKTLEDFALLETFQKEQQKYKHAIKTNKNLTTTHVVIMGRSIKKLNTDQETIQLDKEIIPLLNKTYQNTLVSGFVSTDGYEFQSIVKNFETAFKIILNLKKNEILKKIKMRYVFSNIHIQKNFQINKNQAWNINGQGFTGPRILLNKKNNPFDIFFYPNFKNIKSLFQKLNQYEETPQKFENTTYEILKILKELDFLKKIS